MNIQAKIAELEAKVVELRTQEKAAWREKEKISEPLTRKWLSLNEALQLAEEQLHSAKAFLAQDQAQPAQGAKE